MLNGNHCFANQNAWKMVREKLEMIQDYAHISEHLSLVSLFFFFVSFYFMWVNCRNLRSIFFAVLFGCCCSCCFCCCCCCWCCQEGLWSCDLSQEVKQLWQTAYLAESIWRLVHCWSSWPQCHLTWNPAVASCLPLCWPAGPWTRTCTHSLQKSPWPYSGCWQHVLQTCQSWKWRRSHLALS